MVPSAVMGLCHSIVILIAKVSYMRLLIWTAPRFPRLDSLNAARLMVAGPVKVELLGTAKSRWNRFCPRSETSNFVKVGYPS